MAATPQGLSEETYDLPMQADDIESAPAELERSALEGLDSGVPVIMDAQAWEDLRLQLHRSTDQAS